MICKFIINKISKLGAKYTLPIKSTVHHVLSTNNETLTGKKCLVYTTIYAASTKA